MLKLSLNHVSAIQCSQVGKCHTVSITGVGSLVDQ